MVQERQDRSLWKITLSLPESCISELEKVKDRYAIRIGLSNVQGINEKEIDSILLHRPYIDLADFVFDCFGWNFKNNSIRKQKRVSRPPFTRYFPFLLED